MTYKEFERIWDSKETHILCHTSGSTGTPKQIFLSKEYMLASARRTNDFFGITESSHLYSCISPDFIGGRMMFVRSRAANCGFGYETPSNRPLTLRNDRQHADLISIVPSQLQFLLNNPQYLLNTGTLLVGGSAIHPHLASKCSDAGIPAYESYGMTETASHIAVRKISSERLPFKLLPGIKISSIEGCLRIEMHDGTTLQTNDLVEITGDDEFFITGRKDNVIISGGLKISPEEIEHCLQGIIDRPFIVTSAPDEKWGERLVLCIQLENIKSLNDYGGNIREAATDTELKICEAINEFAEKNLPSHKRPKSIYFTDSLPLIASGKLKRFKLGFPLHEGISHVSVIT